MVTYAFSDMSAPATGAAAVTPDTNADLPISGRGLYVGGAGNVVVTTLDGQVVTFTAVPAGSFLPICVRRVHATGTATNMVVVW